MEDPSQTQNSVPLRTGVAGLEEVELVCGRALQLSGMWASLSIVFTTAVHVSLLGS